ncbi:DUF4175 family protein [Luteolibacter sp. Y139]|uniref:DUF4175 family protein n=2 Tax=Luteolibacter soli TaxID=3135280 RepID=A0ABU9B0P3_9BACT
MSAPPPSSDASRELHLPATVARTLDRVRRRQLAFALALFPVLLVATLATAWLLQAVADRVFHLPWSARCVLLVLDVIGALILLDRFAVRAWKRRLNRKGAALLVERGIPDFRSALVSVVELTSPDADVSVRSRPLVARLISDVEERVSSAEVVRQVVRPDRLKKLLTRAVAPVALAALAIVLCQPLSGLLVQRILLADVALPAATQVVSVTEDLTVDEGGQAILTANASGEIPPDGKVVISYAGRPAETVMVPRSDKSPDEFSLPMANLREGFSYHFLLNDGVGREHQVSVRFPPVAEGLKFVQVPPAYTGLSESELTPTSLKLLEGSTLRIEGTATRPLRAGELRIGGVAQALPLTIEADRRSFRAEVAVSSEGWKSLGIHMTSNEEVESVKDPVYPVELVRDRAPAVTIHTPKDEASTVIANDTVPVSFEVSDDFGIHTAKLVYRVYRMMPDGSTEEGEEGQVPLAVPPGKTTWKHTFSWNLALLVPEVSTGYSITFSIEATDNHADAPRIGRSAERTLKVVSEQEKRLELLELLGQKAAEIERLYEQQRSVNERLQHSNP